MNANEQSPFIYSDAVFSARVLLGLDPDDVPLPERGSVTSESVKQTGLIFFPNPTSDQICFVTPESVSPGTPLTIDLYNIFGQWVDQTLISAASGENCLTIKKKLDPGLYLLRVILDGKNLGIGKVVIR